MEKTLFLKEFLEMSKPSRRQIEKEKTIVQESRDIHNDFTEIRRTYEEFKRLRRLIGRPVTDKLDPDKIRKDLSGRDFFC
jgi:hypothetical protein